MKITEGELPPLPFEPGDTANLACHAAHSGALNDQHTLSIDRDDNMGFEDGDFVSITMIYNGQPQGNITVDRRELLAALGA